MSSRIILVFVLALNSFNICAGNSQWLSSMINKKEAPVQHIPTMVNKKDKGFFSTHALILFYGSQCPHCRQFAPVLKRWANQRNAEVLPLSFDNQPLPEFPKFLPATTEWVTAAFQGSAINYPALFLVNPATKVLYPVGFGEMTDSELSARMELLIVKVSEFEQKGRAS
jgi:type-F conjugative transfer system pilin assembly thiol-disulfide isomerase TrbB